MLSENGKIPGSRPITARTARNGASEVTGHAQAVSNTPPIRADFIKGGLRMAFFNSAVGVLQTLVVALGAGLGIWGAINLMEGYGNDNPGAKSQGMKQLMAK